MNRNRLKNPQLGKTMKVGVAAGFRPVKVIDRKEDGSEEEEITLKAIPASEQIRDVPPEHPLYNSILPIIGYLCFYNDSMKKPFWRFMEYRASVLYSDEEKAAGKMKDLPARIGTTTVANLYCHNCGTGSPFPIWGKGISSCPFCGARTGVEANIIKEGSPEFFSMVAELKDPIEEAARNASAGDTPFEFPPLLLCASNVAPSASPRIPPALQGAAQEKGLSFVTMDEISMDELKMVQDPSLQLVPEITSGVMDSEALRAGKGWGTGCIRYFAKANLPQVRQKPAPITFKPVRF